MDDKLTTPYRDVLPPRSGDEQSALKASVHAEGIRDKVQLNERGEVIDGHGRLESDPNAPTRVIPGSGDWTDAETRAYIIRTNTGRRNLSAEQIKECCVPVAKELMREGKTDAATAALIGVDRSTVTKWMDRKGHNVKGHNVSIYDNRVKIPKESHPAIISRVMTKGHKPERVAADLKVSPKTIRRIVKEGSQQQTARQAVANYQRKLCRELGQFALIYADPPWRFEFEATECRAIERHYPTMSLEELYDLPVPEISLQTSILMMWAPNAKNAEAILLAERWGFTYRTNMVWIKNKIGTGFYARNRHEMLLICCKGKMSSPEPSNRPDSVIEAPRGEHSVKPRIVYERIDRMYPQFVGKEYRIEWFRRGADEELDKTWETWGNEAPSQSMKTTAQDAPQRPQTPVHDQ